MFHVTPLPSSLLSIKCARGGGCATNAAKLAADESSSRVPARSSTAPHPPRRLLSARDAPMTGDHGSPHHDQLFSLLSQLLEHAPDVFQEEILTRLDNTDTNLLSRVSRACRAAVSASPFGVCAMCHGTEVCKSMRSGTCPCVTHPRDVVREKPPFDDVSKFLVSIELVKWAIQQDCAPADERWVAKAAAKVRRCELSSFDPWLERRLVSNS